MLLFFNIIVPQDGSLEQHSFLKAADEELLTAGNFQKTGYLGEVQLKQEQLKQCSNRATTSDMDNATYWYLDAKDYTSSKGELKPVITLQIVVVIS